MLLHRRTLVFVLAVVFGLALLLVLSRASLADHTDTHEPNPNAPVARERDMVEEDACPDFAVLFEISGKIKFIEKTDGRVIVPRPGTQITLTNVEEPENQITVRSTGTFHDTPLPNGDLLSVVTGPVLFWPPLELVRGRVATIVDSETFEIIEFVSRQGKTIDLCARLA